MLVATGELEVEHDVGGKRQRRCERLHYWVIQRDMVCRINGISPNDILTDSLV